MKIHTIKHRNVIFEFAYPDWNLNLHLIMGEKHDFLIDTGMGRENIEPILAYRNKRGRSNPLVIINTHYHFDHIWGNYLFKGHWIVAHQSCVEKIKQDWEPAIEKYHAFWDDEIEQCLPNVLISEELYFAQDGIKIFYTPGHSPDGISVLDEWEKVLNVGDNIGDTMEEIVPELECEKGVYLKALEKYKATDFTHLVSGHNRICDKSVIGKIKKSLQE